MLTYETYADQKPMLPAPSDPHAPRVRGLLQLERAIFSSWFRWLCTNSKYADAS